MRGIKDRVAIVGMGCSNFGERWDSSAADLMVEAGYEAYADAGLEAKDIQAAWLGTVSSFRTGQPLAEALKLDYIPITRVENACATATDAFRNACYAVAAGIYDIVLAVGVEKLKDSGFSGLAIPEAPGADVAPPTPPPSQFAMAATRYFHQYDIPYDQGKLTLAEIAAKNHHNGTLNPKAHFQREITTDQVINAPMIAWPLGLFDCCGVSDGAAAAIITTPEIAQSLRKDYVLVKGLGLSVGAFGVLRDDWDFTHFPETVKASQSAYDEAGISDPREDIDLAMVHDCFTITELIICEDLGFSARGKASEDVHSGSFTLEGDLPVNTDGGLKCFGHPVGASGIRMIYEVYKQLQGKAEGRQLKKADVGLTHNLGGRPGSFTCSVAIFGSAE
ncbi:MAG: acetyl-CoA acetyltransferase [Dehalococcoidia bacterium]|nr:MAG: acetyl-CoA acetyltransferase [Dehalococcoidia bacterium]|tara:strand:+ start:3521 stop:4693 length:1173 start_codon:yes stop_codon:yes gene_type:complete